MPQYSYSGDRSGVYDDARGTGLVGKVVGPGRHGLYFVITEANYDADRDMTLATAVPLQRPEHRLDEMTGTTQ